MCVKEYQNNKDTDPINSQPFTFVDVDVVVDVAWVLKRGSIGVAFVACGFVPRRCRLRVSSEWQSCDSCARARACVCACFAWQWGAVHTNAENTHVRVKQIGNRRHHRYHETT